MTKHNLFFIAKALCAALSFLILAAFGRLFGEEGIAEVGTFLAILNFATTSIVWGANVSLADGYNRGHGEIAFANSFTFVLLNALLAGTLFMIPLSIFSDLNPATYSAIPLALGMLLASHLVLNKSPFLALTVFELARSIIPLFITTLFILSQSSIQPTSAIMYSYGAIILLLPFYLIPILKIRKNLPSAKKLIFNWIYFLKHNANIALPTIFIVLSTQFDRVLLSTSINESDLAAYIASQTLLAIVLIGIQSSLTLYIPKISAICLHATGTLVTESITTTKRALKTGAFSIAVGYFYFSFIGVELATAFKLYSILIAGIGISLLFGVGLTGLQYLSSKKPFFFISIASIIIQISCLTITTPYIGIYSGPTSFITALIFSRCLAWLFFKRIGIPVAVWEKGSPSSMR